MKIVFVSNYINHHQIPFCNAMWEETEGQFAFIQTQPMEEERVQMGWQDNNGQEYLHRYYEEEALCKKLILDSDVVLFGGCDDECYVEERLKSGKPLVRISERLYKTGQWKAVSPRGLLKKYHDHTKYRNQSVYLLCAGAYVSSDFHIVRSYPQKMFCWGYFPETKHYDVDKLLENKGYEQKGDKIPYLLWAGRFIDWKHPLLPLQTAKYLKDQGLAFHMDMVGGGAMEPEVRDCLSMLGLEDCVNLTGYKTPEEVRGRMEKADIYLLTSDRQEGWGAVANEAMNSGCALIANHMVGAAPYLVCQGQNGFLFRDGKDEMLFETAEKLVKDEALRKSVGRNAYTTITEVWNAGNAAKELLKLIENVVLPGESSGETPKDMEGLRPCAPAPVISEKEMWRKISCKRICH